MATYRELTDERISEAKRDAHALNMQHGLGPQ